MLNEKHPFAWTFLYWLILLATVLSSPFLSFLSYFLQIILTLVLIKWGYSIHPSLEEYGISIKQGTSCFFIIGISLGFLCISSVLLFELLTNLILFVSMAETTITLLVSDLVVYISLQMIVAVVEELTFRGYIFQNTIHSNYRFAFIWVSVLFSLSHFPSIWFSILGSEISPLVVMSMLGFLFTASVFLCSLLIKFNSLWVSIGFHFSWNYFQYHIFGLTGDGIFHVLPVAGSDLLHGGLLGPEGGLIALIMMISCMALGLLMIRKKTNPLSIL